MCLSQRGRSHFWYARHPTPPRTARFTIILVSHTSSYSKVNHDTHRTQAAHQARPASTRPRAHADRAPHPPSVRAAPPRDQRGLAVPLRRVALSAEEQERTGGGAGEEAGVVAQVRLGVERVGGVGEEADVYCGRGGVLV